MFLTEPILFLLFVAGGAALIMGARKLGVALVMPGLLRWIVLPVLLPQLNPPFIWPLLLLAPIAALFFGIKCLQGALGAVYGSRVAGHVAATYLVAVLDRLGAAAWWLASSPFVYVARWVGTGRWTRRG